MMDLFGITEAAGLDAEAKSELEACLEVAASVEARNRTLTSYYEGDYDPAPIGIDVIPESAKPSARCNWPKKAVTSVSERSRFDAFSFAGGYSDGALEAACARSGLAAAYNRNVANELVHGCMFGTVNATPRGAVARIHTAESAAATWDAANARIASGLVVADVRRAPWSGATPVPVQANLHLPGRVVKFVRTGPALWRAESGDTPLGRPLMEAFCWRATGVKPFGETRITGEVMDIADEVVRTRQNLCVSAALYSHPQKYALGLTSKALKKMAQDKLSHAIASMFLATGGGSGEKVEYGQLPAVSPEPYRVLIETYAALFSASTGVPMEVLTSGQANPASADAIQVSREDITVAADDLNESSAEALRNMALMMMAVEGNTGLSGLTDEQMTVRPVFRDTESVSLAARADAMCKIAGIVPEFAQTRAFWEGLGKDDGEIGEIMDGMDRAAAKAGVRALMSGLPADGGGAR